MKCGFCGYRFDEREAEAACASCPLPFRGGCPLVRCPRCGFEAPKETSPGRGLRRVWRWLNRGVE